LAGAVVVPDRCGHGQQALKDAHEDPTWGVSTVLFQIELSLKGVEDRLDALAERFEEPAAGSFGFALASTAQQLDAALGDAGLELSPEVILVHKQDLPSSGSGQGEVVVEKAEQDLAFVGLGAGQREPDGQPVQGRDQVQPQPPEEPRIACAVTVFGPACQV